MARHEYNALNMIRNARIKGLVAPVQLLIDVQGFRLSATPLLPIGHAGSLVYGSDDAAVRVHVRGSAAVELALPTHTDLGLPPYWCVCESTYTTTGQGCCL